MSNNINNLITSIKNNDEMAVGKLYEAIKPKSISIAKQYVNEADAEDMFHNAFIKALDNLDSFDGSRAFMPWFDVILVNTCKNYIAKKDNSATKNFSEMDDNSPISEKDNNYINSLKSTDDDYNPEANLDAKALQAIMGDIINGLSDDQKEALVLFYYQEMSVKDIAAKKGVSENTIKSRLNYARKKVGQDVEDYEKKHGIKLRSVGALPLLLIYFRTSGGAAAAAKISASAIGAASGAASAATGAATGFKASFMKFISTVYGKIIAATAGVAVVGGVAAGVILMQPSDQLVCNITTSMHHNADYITLDELRLLGSHDFITKDENGKATIAENPSIYANYANADTYEFQQVLFKPLLEHKDVLFEYYQKMNDVAYDYAQKNPGCGFQDVLQVTGQQPLDVTEYYPDEITVTTKECGDVTIKVSRVDLSVYTSTVLENPEITDTREGAVFKLTNGGPEVPIKHYHSTLQGVDKLTFIDSFHVSVYGKIK